MAQALTSASWPSRDMCSTDSIPQNKQTNYGLVTAAVFLLTLSTQLCCATSGPDSVQLDPASCSLQEDGGDQQVSHRKVEGGHEAQVVFQG